MATSSSQPRATEVGERPSETYGSHSTSQLNPASRPTNGLTSKALPKPAPCHESRNRCHSPDASVVIGLQLAAGQAGTLRVQQALVNAPRNITPASTAQARKARKPGLVTMRCGRDGGTVRDSASSETGPGSASTAVVPRPPEARATGRSGVSASWTRSQVPAAAVPGLTNSAARWRRRTWVRPRNRQRAAIELIGWNSAPMSPSSTQAC